MTVIWHTKAHQTRCRELKKLHIRRLQSKEFGMPKEVFQHLRSTPSPESVITRHWNTYHSYSTCQNINRDKPEESFTFKDKFITLKLQAEFKNSLTHRCPVLLHTNTHGGWPCYYNCCFIFFRKKVV